MKKIFLLISAILFIFPVQAQHTLRLMTYNIKNANGMDDICSFQRVANVINNASPDVVAIQEVDSMTRRSGQKYVLGEIAECTQMHACFAPAIEFEGGKYGIGLLTKQVPLRLQTIPLPGREEARTLILAEFEDYIYCCTHLSLTEEDRMKSLEIVKSLIASYKKPLFLAGDLNRNPISSKNCKRIFKYSPIRKSILILLPIQKKPLIILPHQSKTLPDLLSYLRE